MKNRESKLAETKEDRRIRRTRDTLSDALVELIAEKGYEAVTIQDVIDRANVGRSTFYAHFENKEQLFFNGRFRVEDLLFGSERRNDDDAAAKSPIDFLSLYFHVAEKERVVRAVLGDKGGGLMARHVQGIIAHKLAGEPRTHSPQKKTKPTKEEAMRTLLAEAAAAALVRLLVCWLEAGMPAQPEEMARRSAELVSAIMPSGR